MAKRINAAVRRIVRAMNNAAIVLTDEDATYQDRHEAAQRLREAVSGRCPICKDDFCWIGQDDRPCPLCRSPFA